MVLSHLQYYLLLLILFYPLPRLLMELMVKVIAGRKLAAVSILHPTPSAHPLLSHQRRSELRAFNCPPTAISQPRPRPLPPIHLLVLPYHTLLAKLKVPTSWRVAMEVELETGGMCRGPAMEPLLTVLLHLLHHQSTSLSLVVHLQALQLPPGYPPLPMLDPHLLQLALLTSLVGLQRSRMVLPARSWTLPRLCQIQVRSYLLQHPRRHPRMLAHSLAHLSIPSQDRDSRAIVIDSMVAQY